MKMKCMCTRRVEYNTPVSKIEEEEEVQAQGKSGNETQILKADEGEEEHVQAEKKQ
jgi:hypothetical protein